VLAFWSARNQTFLLVLFMATHRDKARGGNFLLSPFAEALRGVDSPPAESLVFGTTTGRYIFLQGVLTDTKPEIISKVFSRFVAVYESLFHTFSIWLGNSQDG
jgi:hypothetical protein